MLNVTELDLQIALERLGSLQHPLLNDLAPREAFDLLDRALYLDDGASSEQIEQDAARFSKFNFLTNGGESFDHSKSFVVDVGESVRVLFTDDKDSFHTADVPRMAFACVIRDFLKWLTDEGARAG